MSLSLFIRRNVYSKFDMPLVLKLPTSLQLRNALAIKKSDVSNAKKFVRTCHYSASLRRISDQVGYPCNRSGGNLLAQGLLSKVDGKSKSPKQVDIWCPLVKPDLVAYPVYVRKLG